MDSGRRRHFPSSVRWATSQVAAEEVSPHLRAFSPNLAGEKKRVSVLPDDGCARLPLLLAETAAMPEAGVWAARISSAAMAKSVMLAGGPRASTTRTDSGSCRRKRTR